MYSGLTAHWVSQIAKERRVSKVDCADIGESIINGLSSSCFIILIILSCVVIPVTVLLDIFIIGTLLLFHALLGIFRPCLKFINSVMINPYLCHLKKKEK